MIIKTPVRPDGGEAKTGVSVTDYAHNFAVFSKIMRIQQKLYPVTLKIFSPFPASHPLHKLSDVKSGHP